MYGAGGSISVQTDLYILDNVEPKVLCVWKYNPILHLIWPGDHLKERTSGSVCLIWPVQDVNSILTSKAILQENNMLFVFEFWSFSMGEP